ncbi:hypothetical protein [Actinomadura opuntiae]|uniref:hypothetical protein n=1 Tax=Actinomadura sp. OS1-43 TaxID=604315 RepID=UPI00255ABCD6|nr:hypothetical protein [Actinomadura sp. OS1-43]MDL4812798.1 hypothetical protein [Actinomadura sp. OS1-43]
MPHRTGHGRGEDAASARRVEAAQKRARALELRKAGATYDQIAQQVGFSNRGTAQRAVVTALREITAEPARDVLALELERLDAMLLGLWPDARRGDQQAIDRVLRIQERRARYLGLDSDRGGLGAAGVESLLEVLADDEVKNAPRRHPAEVLLDCVHTADVLLTATRKQVQDGQASPASLEGLRVALDYAAKWAEKTVALDIASQQQRVFEQVGAVYVGALRRIVERLGLDEQQRAMVPQVVEAELAAITAGDQPDDTPTLEGSVERPE